MSEILYVVMLGSIVTGVFTLIGIELMQKNWLIREKVRYGYQLKRAKIKETKGITVKKGAPTDALDWINKLKSINPDVLHNLIDMVGGEGESEEEGGITGTIERLVEENPEIVSKFLEGLGGKSKQESKETDQYL